MSDRRETYLDSSAIVKLVDAEPESQALRRFLHRRGRLTSSALARTEVVRAVLPLGPHMVRRAEEVLTRFQLLRLNNRVLNAAAALGPHDLRSLDAIHLASAAMLGQSLHRVITYDERMASAAKAMGFTVASPA